jgi:hypothetical protein
LEAQTIQEQVTPSDQLHHLGYSLGRMYDYFICAALLLVKPSDSCCNLLGCGGGKCGLAPGPCSIIVVSVIVVIVDFELQMIFLM